jgi:hypothetical protein
MEIVGKGSIMSCAGKADILTAPIYEVFRGFNFEPDTEIGPKASLSEVGPLMR